MDPRARLTLSISVSPLAKALSVVALTGLIVAAVAGMVLLEGNMRLLLLPLLPMIGYAALGLGRQRWWIDGTVLYHQKALRTKRIDLSHANVEVGYIAGGERLSTMKVRDVVHGKRMTVPLLTLAGRPLPREQMKCLHDAIVAGQRWRRGKAADRAAVVSSYLQTLS